MPFKGLIEWHDIWITSVYLPLHRSPYNSKPNREDDHLTCLERTLVKFPSTPETSEGDGYSKLLPRFILENLATPHHRRTTNTCIDLRPRVRTRLAHH